MQFTVTHDMDTLQRALVEPARAGQRLALVPTMGALHEGHMALIRHAATLADAVAVSIFVNPKQFGPNEDLDKYPRMLEADIEKARAVGASLVYAPPVGDLYPDDFSTTVSAGPLSAILEGKFRPGHFDGVATVVAKLLLRMLPCVAVFGEKDYQQLCVIRRIVDDLDIPVDIVGMPTVREPDGLAMSSRNAYLTPQERTIAPKLHEMLTLAAQEIGTGAVAAPVLAQAIARLEGLGYKVEYLELRETETLAPMESLNVPARLLVAAWLGKTRLIDNIAVG